MITQIVNTDIKAPITSETWKTLSVQHFVYSTLGSVNSDQETGMKIYLDTMYYVSQLEISWYW